MPKFSKNKIIFFLGIIFVILFLPQVSLAANWYVDNAASGNNNGTSWTNAWQSFAAIAWSSIQPGDTVYISGGTTSKIYNEKWSVGVNGSSGQTIAIRPGQDVNHNGLVIFDYDSMGDNGTGTGISINGRSYIVIDGDYGGSKHIVIKNLRNITNRSDAYAIRGYSTPSNIIVRNVEIDNCNNGIVLSSNSTGVTINNNYFHNIRGDTAIGLLSSTGAWDANKIYNNQIELLWNDEEPPEWTGAAYTGPDGIQSGSGVSIYNNAFRVYKAPQGVYTSNQHTDYIQGQGNYNKIYNNDFIDIGDSAIDFDASYGNRNLHDVRIYNNLFRIVDSIDLYPEYIRSRGALSYADILIANNVFVDNTLWPNIRISALTDNPPASNFDIKNNIFYNVGGNSYFPIISIVDSSGFNENSFHFSNNIYHKNGTTYITFRDTTYTLEQWKTNYEPSSILNAPTFISYLVNNINNNYNLASSDAIAKNTGIDLSSYFIIDKEGVSRPQGLAWDIGAYEYITSDPSPDTTPPSAPMGLTVQ